MTKLLFYLGAEASKESTLSLVAMALTKALAILPSGSCGSRGPSRFGFFPILFNLETKTNR